MDNRHEKQKESRNKTARIFCVFSCSLWQYEVAPNCRTLQVLSLAAKLIAKECNNDSEVYSKEASFEAARVQ